MTRSGWFGRAAAAVVSAVSLGTGIGLGSWLSARAGSEHGPRDERDDAAYLQRMIDEQAPSGTVFLPPGHYHITSTLNVPANVVVYGGGSWISADFRTSPFHVKH